MQCSAPGRSPGDPAVSVGELLDHDPVSPLIGLAADRRAMTVGAGGLLVAELACAYALAVALER